MRDPHKSVTNRLFNRFLEKKAPEKPCPECGTNAWLSSLAPGHVASEDAPLAVGYLLAMGANDGFPTLSLHCDNCGFVKLFSAHIVREWLKDNG